MFHGLLLAALEVIAVYYPHWHRYPKGDEWFGDRWDWSAGEWAFVKTAKPRFPGHNQPLVPLAGYLKGDSPADMEKEIALASNAGIDVFLYDYYYYGGRVTQEEALENGFLKAKNRNRMKFALMWCYHERRDQFRPQRESGRRMLMELSHTPEEFLGLIDLSIERYFRRPEYWRKDGKLFFSIYTAPYFVAKVGEREVRDALAEARRRVREAGLGEVHFNAQNFKPEFFARGRELGFDSATDYNVGPHGRDCSTRYANGEREIDYGVVIENNEKRWQLCRSAGALPYIPSVTTGWDRTPRCRPEEPYPWGGASNYPYEMTVTNNTPDRFEAYLRKAKEIAERSPLKPNAVYINGWNEYTEGAWLVPDNFHADGMLRAIASVFGRKPAGEYTYVNPSTRQLYTIPAATRENVPYGSHPKQKVDLFLPSKGKAPYPVVQYLHGGGWSGGAMEDHILGSAIRMLLDRGIAVVGTGYRYIRDCKLDGVNPPVRGCLDDCEAAVRFVRAKADEWNLDRSRFALAGGSAGACTALYLGLKDGNSLGIAAVAPIIAQTSLDPREMREWIPNSTYGGHAFGYRNFDDWLAHRDDCLAWIERFSPAALARRIDPSRSPRIFLQYGGRAKEGELAKDATHSPVFGEKFKALCGARGIACEMGYGGRPLFGDAFVRLADLLLAQGSSVGEDLKR